MSLFKDILDELEQAVNEIETEQTEDLFELVSEIDEADVDQDLYKSILEDEVVTEKNIEEVVETVALEEATILETIVKEEPKREISEEDKNAVTVITKGTTVNGNIISDCSLDVMGTVNGDIECLGKLTVSGKVTGNARASEVVINADRLEGSIVSEGSVKVGLGTVVIGDVTAVSAVFVGAVKGEIDVKGPVVLESTAIIKGNIKAKSIQIANGAVIDGFCSLCYANLKIDSIYE